MKKLLALILVLSTVLCVAACGPADTTDPNATSINVCLASEPQTLDPALNSAVDGATMCAHLFSGLAKWAQDENGTLVIVPDLAMALVDGVVGEDGKVTYTYTLKEGLKWSNGDDLTAAHIVDSWNRAASAALGADYGYMFEVVDGYAEVSAVTEKLDENGNVVIDEESGEPVYVPANLDAKLNVTAKDERTIEVVLANAVAYWNELLAFPTYYPVHPSALENDEWATDPSTYINNGPYVMKSWAHNSMITLEKNDNYHAADTVKMDIINFYLSDDANNMLANFKNGEWLLIDDVPVDEIKTLETEYPEEFVIAGQIGTYYVCWNVNEDILPEGNELTGEAAEAAKAEIRNAVGLLFDRNYLVEAIAQGGQLPASSFVAMGMTHPDGTEFYKVAGSADDDFDGYYDVSEDAQESNFAAAIETLKKYYTWDDAAKKFTNFPSMTYLYNTSDSHKAIGEYLQGVLASVGIDMQLDNQEWNVFLETRKNGEYSIARNGWLADYNDPICFLDMWTSISGNNDVQYGKGAHKDLAMYNLDLTAYGYETKVENGTWAETFDVLISTIKSCTDNETRYELMHLAEDMLMETGCIVPLYYYTDLYMVDDSVKGFFSNPLGYKYFMYCTVEG